MALRIEEDDDTLNWIKSITPQTPGWHDVILRDEAAIPLYKEVTITRRSKEYHSSKNTSSYCVGETVTSQTVISEDPAFTVVLPIGACISMYASNGSETIGFVSELEYDDESKTYRAVSRRGRYSVHFYRGGKVAIHCH